MNRSPLPIRLASLLLLGCAALPTATAAPVDMGAATSYTQNFDTLPVSGTANAWTDDTNLAGWYAQRTTGTTVIIASNGSSNTGGFHSFGTTDATERAFGSIGSGTPGNLAYGVLLRNTTTSTLTINALNYTGEQWRNGGNATAHKLTFSYQKSADVINNLEAATALPANWVGLAAADFTGPIATATAAALDGNLTANQAVITTNPVISVPAAQYVMLRWHDLNDSGNDHGLGIDNLTISWAADNTPPLTLTAVPNIFFEDLGATASEGTVSIPTALAANLTVTLSSSDVTEASVPATVTILAGSTSATFPIAAVNDLLKDGPQAVTLTAAATGYLPANASLTVDDDTDAYIDVQINPLTFDENAGMGAATGTVALAEITSVDVIVSLTSSKPDEATVPFSVTIKKDTLSAGFVVTAVDDSDLDGDQSVRIEATADGYSYGFRNVTVKDNEVPPPATLSAGAIAFTGFDADGNDDLAFVALVNIPAGEVIFLTDNEWNGLEIGVDGKFIDSNEGFLIWTSPVGGVAAGTVVTLNNMRDVTRSTNLGTLVQSGSGTMDLGTGGDTVYAYQGTLPTAVTGFLAVIASHDLDSTANTGLSANHIVLLTNAVDIAAYTGSRGNKTTFAGYLDSLVNMANWITEDGSGDQSANGTAPDLPFATTAFSLATGNSYSVWADANAGGGKPDEDFDKDGVPNGVEYFMGSPAGFTATPGIVGNKITWPMNPTAVGVSYEVQTSETLATGSWTQATTGVNVVGGNLEFAVPSTAGKLFVRLKVTVN